MSISIEFLKVVNNRGESSEKLSEKKLAGFLSAIKRADITDMMWLMTEFAPGTSSLASQLLYSMKPTQIGFLLSTWDIHSKEASESRVKAAEIRGGN